MITITLRLSESLLSIFRDAGTPMDETRQIRVETGTTVAQILAQQHINPLLVPMIGLDNGDGRQQRIDIRTALRTDAALTLHGPLAGG